MGTRVFVCDHSHRLVQSNARLLCFADAGGEELLGGLFFLLLGRHLFFSIVGFDRPGILAWLTGKFLDVGANIVACDGSALKAGKGAHFEFTTNSKDKLPQLFKAFENEVIEFGDTDHFVPGRFFDMEVQVPRDAEGLLHIVATVLLGHRVNMTAFHADKLADCFFKPVGEFDKGFFGGSTSRSAHAQVKIFARLEVPDDVDSEEVKRDLLAKMPQGTTVTLDERHCWQEPQEADEPESVCGRK